VALTAVPRFQGAFERVVLLAQIAGLGMLAERF
jgi:hypothetical protein